MNSALLVEEDTKLSMALKLRLGYLNYSVHSVNDAVRAMDVAVRSKPNVILLDINIPGGNGFIVADRLRAHPDTMTIPIIFITASESAEIRDRAESFPNAHFILKPFDAMQLQEKLQHCD